MFKKLFAAMLLFVVMTPLAAQEGHSVTYPSGYKYSPKIKIWWATDGSRTYQYVGLDFGKDFPGGTTHFCIFRGDKYVYNMDRIVNFTERHFIGYSLEVEKDLGLIERQLQGLTFFFKITDREGNAGVATVRIGTGEKRKL